MFCKQCGCQIPDSAMYCPRCGTANASRVATSSKSEDDISVASAERNETEVIPHVAMAAGVVAATQQANAEEKLTAPAKPKKRTAAITSIVLVVLLVLGGIAGFYFWNAEQQRIAAEKQAQEQWELDHRTYTSLVSLVVPDYDEASSTPIPVQVSGTDFEGNAVSEYFGLTPTHNSIELMRGAYTVRVVASPVNGAGGIYQVPSATISIVVDDNGVQEDGSETSGGSSAKGFDATANEQPDGVKMSAPFEFIAIAPEDITDEQIAAIGEALERIGFSAEETSSRCNMVRNYRQARLDQIEAERAEAERRAAEEAARRQNPASVDGSANAATLKGRVVREEKPRSVTGMGWSAVVYFLEFDAPVQITYQSNSGVSTQSATRVQIDSVEQYMDDADKNLDTAASKQFHPYVGQYVAVSGKLLEAGTAHYFAVRMMDPILVEVL